MKGLSMKKITALALSSVLSVAFAGNMATQEFKGFASPESVYVTSQYVLVSNVGPKLDPLAKDNDGFISKLDKNGNVIEKEFIKGINAPKGMSVVDGVLYVVDIDVLRGFNLKTKKQVFEMPIKGAIFLNDIAVKDSNTLYVSDTGTGIIHEVNLKNARYKTLVKIPSEYMGPNGLLKNGNELITVTYDPNGKDNGRVLKINLKDKKITVFSDLEGPLDGVAFDKKGNLLVTSWGENLKGALYSIDRSGHVKKVDLPDMAGPADIFYDHDKNTLWIPKMAENAILKLQF